MRNERGLKMLTADELGTLRETLKTDFPDLDNDSKALIMSIAERNAVDELRLITLLSCMLLQHPEQTSGRQGTSV